MLTKKKFKNFFNNNIAALQRPYLNIMAETIHIGRKISRIREIRGIKHDHLAVEMGVSQQTISRIEQSESVEEETIGKVPKALGITSQAIKSFTEDAIINYFHDQSYFN